MPADNPYAKSSTQTCRSTIRSFEYPTAGLSVIRSPRDVVAHCFQLASLPAYKQRLYAWILACFQALASRSYTPLPLPCSWRFRDMGNLADRACLLRSKTRRAQQFGIDNSTWACLLHCTAYAPWATDVSLPATHYLEHVRGHRKVTVTFQPDPTVRTML